MEYTDVIQSILDEIDRRITENIRAEELARHVNYSLYHFCRVFTAWSGMPVKTYITRRKLAYALYDLSQGSKVVDAAVNYGFETHAGFTKAFKRNYGYPPSLYRLHVPASPPQRMTANSIKSTVWKDGGLSVNKQIKEIAPMTVVGYASRHRMPGVGGISDIPAFWDKMQMEYAASLSSLHSTYTNSHHCEIGLCLDVDSEHGYFTYLLGVGVDEADAGLPLRPGSCRQEIAGGLYAIFTTPLVEEEQYAASIRKTWEHILTQWFPQSAYVFDSSREAFEYYDERDHSWLHNGKSCMDIYVPICK